MIPKQDIESIEQVRSVELPRCSVSDGGTSQNATRTRLEQLPVAHSRKYFAMRAMRGERDTELCERGLMQVNKQDLPNALSVEEVTERLNLEQIRNRQWHAQACTAISPHDDGLYKGFDWLARAVGGEKDRIYASLL